MGFILDTFFGVLFGCLFGPLGAHCGPWGLLELILGLLELILGPFGQISQRAPKGPEKGQKYHKTASKVAFWAFGGASGDPEIRTTATFPE